MVSGDTDIFLSSDSDQIALLGHLCLGIKKWQFKSTQKIKALDLLDIFTPSTTTINNILNVLHLPNEPSNLIKPKFAIFDDVQCPRLRSLYAVGLGCDVNLHSVVTPSKLHKFIQNSPMMRGISNEDAYFAVKKFYIDQYNKTDKHSKRISKRNNIVSDNQIETKNYSEMIDILTDAFM
jgi:hypothetical protein